MFELDLSVDEAPAGRAVLVKLLGSMLLLWSYCHFMLLFVLCSSMNKGRLHIVSPAESKAPSEGICCDATFVCVSGSGLTLRDASSISVSSNSTGCDGSLDSEIPRTFEDILDYVGTARPSRPEKRLTEREEARGQDLVPLRKEGRKKGQLAYQPCTALTRQ